MGGGSRGVKWGPYILDIVVLDIVVIFVDLVLQMPKWLSLLVGDLFWQIIKQAEVKMQFEFLKSAGVLFFYTRKKYLSGKNKHYMKE